MFLKTKSHSKFPKALSCDSHLKKSFSKTKHVCLCRCRPPSPPWIPLLRTHRARKAFPPWGTAVARAAAHARGEEAEAQHMQGWGTRLRERRWWPDPPAGAGAPWSLPPAWTTSKARHRLPIPFKIIQASRKILKAVDLFVALATVKLKSLISEDAVQLCGKRIGARETRSVSSEESEGPSGHL